MVLGSICREGSYNVLVVSDTSVYDRHSLLQLVVSSPEMQILLVARNTIPHIPLPELHSTNGVNLRMNNEEEGYL